MYAIDDTHEPGAVSWVASAASHPDFPVQNLPLGVAVPNASTVGGDARIVTAIGDSVLDLASARHLFDEAYRDALAVDHLNALFELGAAARGALRKRLFELLTDPALQSYVEPHLSPLGEASMALPARIGDYTDFYVGIHHATNVGKLFRPDNPLLPNYKHIPIGYHGRASSIRVSGVDVVRPKGQRLPDPAVPMPVYEPTQRLDYELELGIWLGPAGNRLGEVIPVDEAGRQVAGFCLLNDWSARDIQAWEYQPLGPFLAKSFHSTISPWVITPEALAPFMGVVPARSSADPDPLPHLVQSTEAGRATPCLELEVLIESEAMRAQGLPPMKLSHGSTRDLFWSVEQMIAHHSSNGCNLRAGDLLGSGTISGSSAEEYGSLLELTNGGKQPVRLPSGETRSFVEDGDKIIMTAKARRPGFVTIGLGTSEAIIEAAR